MGALAAEVGHELQGPVNLLLSVALRAERKEPLDDEDAASLREELARLRRLSARLRELARVGGRKEPTSLKRLLELGCDAAGVDARDAAFAIEDGGADAQGLTCDRELLGLALGELLQNALEARRSRAGVRVVLGERAGFCVWDDGLGFTLAFEQALTWGVSTRAGGAGLGLSLALRAARAHGLSLECRAESGRTEVWLMIPHRELSPGAKESA